MSEDPEPNTEQITIWRNLLDAFGQLSSAWESAAEAQRDAAAGQGPGTLRLPEELVVAFTHAGARGAEALAGVADVLAMQESSASFGGVADAQRTAHTAWLQAHRAVSGTDLPEE